MSSLFEQGLIKLEIINLRNHIRVSKVKHKALELL